MVRCSEMKSDLYDHARLESIAPVKSLIKIDGE